MVVKSTTGSSIRNSRRPSSSSDSKIGLFGLALMVCTIRKVHFTKVSNSILSLISFTIIISLLSVTPLSIWLAFKSWKGSLSSSDISSLQISILFLFFKNLVVILLDSYVSSFCICKLHSIPYSLSHLNLFASIFIFVPLLALSDLMFGLLTYIFIMAISILVQFFISACYEDEREAGDQRTSIIFQIIVMLGVFIGYLLISLRFK